MENLRRVAPTNVLILAGLTLAGAVLRFYGLGENSLWFDEAVIYHLVQGGWRDILTHNALENSAPPLYALLLGLLTGPDASEAALRSLSAAASVAAIPLCYLLAREFVSSRAVWLAPVLMVFAPTQLYYAQQLREYSLTTAVAAALLIAYARYIRLPNTRNAALVASIAVLGLVTQYGLGLMLAALNIVLVVTFIYNKRSLTDYGRWILTQLPAAVVAAVLFVTVVQYQSSVVDVAGTTGYLSGNHWDGTARGLFDLLASPGHDIIGFAYPGILAMLLVAVGTFAFCIRTEAALAAAFFVAPTAMIYFTAVLGVYPYGAIRQDIFLTPMVYVIAAVGLEQLAAFVPRNWPAFVKPVAVGGLSLVLLVPAVGYSVKNVFQRPVGYQPMRRMVGILTEKLLPDDTIYVYYGAIPAFRYYWRNQTEPWIAGSFVRSWMDERAAVGQRQAVAAELHKLVSSGQRTWVVLSHMPNKDRNRLAASLQRSGRMQILTQGPGGSVLLLMNGPIDNAVRNGKPDPES